jgi:hypothetical protein
MGLWGACSVMTPAERTIWCHDQNRSCVDRDIMRKYVSYPVDVGRAVGMQLYIYQRLLCVL